MQEEREFENKIAARIRDYWVAKGYLGIIVKVLARTYKNPLDKDEVIGYFIRSNIGSNGYPPRGVAA